MSADKITPEERLLKIIENPQAEKRRTPAEPKTKGGLSLKDLGLLFENFQVDKNLSQYVTLLTTNKALAVISAIATIFCIFNYAISGTNLKKRLDNITTGATASVISAAKSSLPEGNISDMIALAQRRNIFTFLPVNAAGQQGAAAPDMAQIISTLKLVGILWSDNPQAMIEDTKEQKTYLLNSGDEIGQFKVNKILREKVILGKDRQEWELR